MTGRELTNYDEAFAKMAQQYADDEASGGMFITTRGGVLSFGEEELPGNQMVVVVLDSVRENTFYTEKFDADNMVPPKCYAFSRGKEDPAPHESMQSHPYFEPQHEECSGCQWNEFGSAATGRGKACQNRRRLAVIPAGYYSKKKGSRDFDLHLITDLDHYKTADIAYFKVPVTSVRDWSKYVTGLSASIHRPPVAVITRVWIEPHPKFQISTHFELIEELPEELAPIIMARHEEAVASIIQPYAPPREDNDAKPKKKGIANLRKRK